MRKKPQVEIIYCPFCDKKFKATNFSRHLSVNHYTKLSSKEAGKKFYDDFRKNKNEGKCIECGKSAIFINITKGYSFFCSKKCADKSDTTKSKRATTNKKRYGTKYPLNTEKQINERKKCIKI